MPSSSSSSVSHEYYYVEDEVSVGQIEELMKNPQVVEIRRLGRDHNAHPTPAKKTRQRKKKASSSSSAKANKPAHKRSRSNSHDGGKAKKSCKLCCIIGWIVAVLFFGLFIGYLVAYNNEKDGNTTEETTTPSPTPEVPGFGDSWYIPQSIFNSRPAAEIDAENEFIENILVQMTQQEKVAQMIQPALNQSDSEFSTVGGAPLKFGPTDQGNYAFGSMLNGGGGWPDATMNYNKDNDAFPCPGCDAFKSEPRAYARLLEEFHIDNEKYFEGKGYRIPWMYATDAVHGHNNARGSTLFPHNIGLGAMRNPALMIEIGKATAMEVATTAMDWTFAPAVSVPRFDTWGRTYEGYSEEPSIVFDYSGKMVEGIQGATAAELKTNTKVLSNIKHWVGDGGTINGVDRGDNRYSESDLINIHAPGYFSGLDAGAQVVMVSFNAWTNTANYDPIPEDGIAYNGKLHGSEYICKEVLKERMGFDGIIVTDWLGHTEINGCTEDSCVQMINAGIDVVMLPGKLSWKTFMEDVIANIGITIPEERINDAVRRILRVKYRAGLWHKDSPLGVACHNPDANGVCGTPCSWADGSGLTDAWEVISNDGNLCGRELATGGILATNGSMEIARQAVRESQVLLKNNNNALPIMLQNSMGAPVKIGIAGSASQSFSKINGGWTITWQGGEADGVNTTLGVDTDFPQSTHPTTAIREVADAQGATVVDTCDDDLDYCILMIGEDPYAEMVGDVKRSNHMEFGSLKLSYASDSALVADARAKADTTGMKVITLFFSGRSLYVNEEINNSDAFVASFLPGSAGKGIADVLFETEFDFVGRLPRTWPKQKCHWDVSSRPSTVSEDWMPPKFERSYDDIAAAGEADPFPIGYGLTKADNVQLDMLPLDSRNWGCLVPDPAYVTPPTMSFDAQTNNEQLCSSYRDQYDNAFMQVDCACLGTAPPLSCAGTSPETITVSTVTNAASQPAVSFKVTPDSTQPKYSNHVYFRLDNNHDVSPWFYDTGMITFNIKKVAELSGTAANVALGVGVAFGDGRAAFEMSDRAFYDIAAEYKALAVNTETVMCVPMYCLNGDGLARNWYELAQTFIFETRGAIEVHLSNVTYEGTTNTSVTCGVTVTCDVAKLYPSYVEWNNRVDYTGAARQKIGSN